MPFNINERPCFPKPATLSAAPCLALECLTLPPLRWFDPTRGGRRCTKWKVQWRLMNTVPNSTLVYNLKILKKDSVISRVYELHQSCLATISTSLVWWLFVLKSPSHQTAYSDHSSNTLATIQIPCSL